MCVRARVCVWNGRSYDFNLTRMADQLEFEVSGESLEPLEYVDENVKCRSLLFHV